MSKNLNKNSNTRKVIFEKMQRYYVKYSPKGTLMKECVVRKVRVGSAFCTHECEYNKKYDSEERYIICSRLSEAIDKTKKN